MSLATLFAAFEAHLVTAGNAQSPAIVQVLRGEPINLTNAPVLAYWLQPITPWGPGNTLSKTQKILTLHWEAYFPGSEPTNDVNLNIELRAASIAFAVEAQLMGDVDLGGDATGLGLDLTDAVPGWTDFAGVMCRSIGQDCHIYLAAVADISA